MIKNNLSIKKNRMTSILLLAIAALAFPTLTLAQADADQTQREVTWSTDVAAIFQEKCQECHRPDSIAPMSLLTYDEAKIFAPIIRYRVENRVMPPWHVNPDVGVQNFANDRGLSEEQRQTILAWVDQGALEGDPSEAPAAREFNDALIWRLENEMGTPPDLVVQSEKFDLAAVTQDKWFRPTTPTGLTEAKWVKAIEIRPVNVNSRKVVHHSLAFLVQQDDGKAGIPEGVEVPFGPNLFMEWAVGKAGQVFRPDTGKLMLPDSQITWEMHLHANGERVPDVQVELAVWFHDEPPKHRTILSMFDAQGPNSLDIPPGEIAVTQGTFVLSAPARLENFQPHMHMRGKAMSMEAIYPNGEREVLSFVDNFQWNWQINYIFEEDSAPIVPKGTMIVTRAWHDNTAANPYNPDPEQWVGWGDRTVDEMAHNWVDVTYLSQEEYEAMVAERSAAAGGED
ncbi:MAG: cytochrome c [Gammaproteobacteria bacterium]|nr:cytochrome c [Gammaproteobacteria bacterium]